MGRSVAVSAPPRLLDYALLIALAAIWGASFMLIKVAVGTVPADNGYGGACADRRSHIDDHRGRRPPPPSV